MTKISAIYTLKAGSKTKFLALEGRNRPTENEHVREMIQSLQLYGSQLRPVIVARIHWLHPSKLYIIDGQHLYESLMILNWPIEYKLVEIGDSKDLVNKLAKINSTSKPWSIHDYIRAWGVEKEDYRKLQSYYRQFTLDICNLASILSGNGPTNGGKPAKLIRSGEFEIINESDTVMFLKNLQEILNIVSLKSSRETRYVSSEYYNYMAVCQNYDHQKFLSYINKNELKMHIAVQVVGELFNNIKL